MLQATDARRFRRLAPDPRDVRELAVVAKSRDVRRTVVADAIAAGLRPAIYGSGWETHVDPELLVRDYVPNEELPLLYSSIGVLLNDHWDTMRDWGFVSNRIFDALACGTPVISDYMPEITELFEGAVLTYRDPSELRELVRTTLADPRAARDRAEEGTRVVRARHTMDHRARELLDALARHGLVSGPERPGP
jgi:spore maturation protein CgeB